MKKAIAFILSAVMLLSVTACNRDEDESTPFNYDLSKYVTLGDYLGVEYVPMRTEPTEDEIWNRIVLILDQCSLYAKQMFPEYVYQNITEGSVTYGDIVAMDISLSVDGETREDCTAKDFVTEIGGNFFTDNITSEDAAEAGIDYAFLTQFMTQIEIDAVGKEIGEEYTLTGTFPDDNFDNDVIGKDYVITAKVTQVTERYGHPDAIDEETLKELGEYEDFDDFKADIIDELEFLGLQTDDGEIWHRICYEFKRMGFYDYTLQDYYSEDLTEGTVRYGDVVLIDFEGFVDGERYENACAEDYTLEIGSGRFIKGFEDGLIGAVIGDEVTLKLKFPANYGNADLNGKPVTFTVNVTSVLYRYEHPDVLPDEIMAELYGYGMAPSESFDELWEHVTEELKLELETSAEDQKKDDVWASVVANSTLIGIPDDELENYMNEYTDYYTQFAQYYNYDSLEAFVTGYGMTMEEFMAQGEEVAREEIYNMMLMYQIARAEGFDKLDESVYVEKAQGYMDYYGAENYEELCELAGETTVREWILSDLVLDLVCDNAVAVSE